MRFGVYLSNVGVYSDPTLLAQLAFEADIVVILWSEGGDRVGEVAPYAEAGVTWWLEDLSMERFFSLEEARERLRKGPPAV